MKTSYAVAIVVSVLVASFISAWMVYDSPLSVLLDKDVMVESGIGDVDIQYKNEQVYLMVELIKPLTCKEVIEILGVQQFVVKERTYSPNCKKVNPRLMRITYNQTIGV